MPLKAWLAGYILPYDFMVYTNLKLQAHILCNFDFDLCVLIIQNLK